MLRYLSTAFFTTLLMVGVARAQESDNVPTDGTPADSTQSPSVEEVNEAVQGLNDRMTLVENDLSILKAIKVSGYIQAEWQHFDQKSNPGNAVPGYFDARKNLFTIRRGRLKVQHKLGDLMSYTLQSDVTERGVEIKDAFVELNLLPTDQFNIDIGMFNRPNYEVELSSSARESIERSQVVRAFYPGERDLGIMLSSRYAIAEGFDPKIQLGLFNGPGAPRAETDAIKDFIGRIVFPLPLGGDSPVQADLGGSVYYGGIPQSGATVKKTVGETTTEVPNDASGGMAGFGNNKNFNVEGQIYLDLLPFGATTLKGEFLSGSRATAGSAATAVAGVGKDSLGKDVLKVVTTAATPLQIRNQRGFYAYFIQNIDTWLQLAAKYDLFDRNTDLAGTKVTSASDAATSVLGFGANFFYENVRITLWYEMPTFASDENLVKDRSEDLKDNKTTLRFQYKF